MAEVPPGFIITGRTENAISVIENPRRGIYALEFHPEVRHTDHGAEILKRFIQDMCGIQPNWFPRSFIEETVERVRLEVRGERALCALSGGVDSAVAATLVGRAIGDRLTCLFVDNGLLRKNEFEQVAETLREQAHLNVRAVDASVPLSDPASRGYGPGDRSARSSERNSSVSSKPKLAGLGIYRFLCRGRSIRT